MTRALFHHLGFCTVADFIEQEMAEFLLGYNRDKQFDQPLVRLAQQGKVSWDGVAEFGDLLAGNVLVPDAAKSIIVFRDSQGGYGDLALAAWVYEEARARGLGQEITTE